MNKKTFAYEINRLYLMALALMISMLVVLYCILDYREKEYEVYNTKTRVESIIGGQIPFFVKELSNGRSIVAQLRAKLLVATYRSDDLDIGISFDKQMMYIGDSTEHINEKIEKGDGWGVLNENKVYVVETMKIGDDEIGVIYISMKIKSIRGDSLKLSFYFMFAIIVFCLLILFVASRYSIHKMLIKPIKLLIDNLPNIQLYLKHQTKEFVFPNDFPSYELNLLVESIRDNVVMLEDAIAQRENSRVKIERLNALNLLSKQVAHDIRSPLAALDVAMKNGCVTSEEQRILIRSAVQKIHDIANNLLDENKNNVRRSPIMINVLLESVVSSKRVEYQNQSFEIVLSFENSSYGMFVDIVPVEFSRALSNILNNSFEARRNENDGVKVSISCCRRESNVEICVKDNGKGVDADILSIIKQQNFRSSKKDGNGLGLKQVVQMVEDHDGNIKIFPCENNGTEISISLPLASAPVWFVPSIQCFAGEYIVVIDDDQGIHDLWNHAFRDLDVDVIHFYEPSVFCQHFREIDSANSLFLVDYEYLGSDTNGLEIIINNKISKRSILVTSRYGEDEIQTKCIDHGIKLLPKQATPEISIIVSPKLDSADKNVILIDDDQLVRYVWKGEASKNNISLTTFASIKEFERILDDISKEHIICIDSSLGDGIAGEVYAKSLFEQGFKKIYLMTGHSKDHFPEMHWIVDILGKDFPDFLL